VTGICYVPKNKTLCCAAGTSTAVIYDPKSGEEVTNFIVYKTNDIKFIILKKYKNFQFQGHFC
jgi:hypothetical protein